MTPRMLLKCAEELERPAVLGACTLSALGRGIPVDWAGPGRREWKQTASSSSRWRVSIPRRPAL
jgi:hypothetical protein